MFKSVNLLKIVEMKKNSTGRDHRSAGMLLRSHRYMFTSESIKNPGGLPVGTGHFRGNGCITV